jgi:uncharacterized protein
VAWLACYGEARRRADVLDVQPVARKGSGVMVRSDRTDKNHEDTRIGTSVVADTSDPTAGRIAIGREIASEQVRIIADPAPLGLSAFALTTFLLSLVNARLISTATEPIVLGVALAYGGVAQVLAGMWEFRKGNVFGATAFTSYGAFWISFWAFVSFYSREIPTPQDRSTAVGWYLIAWGIFTVVMWIASLRTTAVLALLFALLLTTFFLLGFGALGHSAGLTRTGGFFGLITAATAWYGCLAGVTASTFGRPLLPNPPLYRLHDQRSVH